MSRCLFFKEPITEYNFDICIFLILEKWPTYGICFDLVEDLGKISKINLQHSINMLKYYCLCFGSFSLIFA